MGALFYFGLGVITAVLFSNFFNAVYQQIRDVFVSDDDDSEEEKKVAPLKRKTEETEDETGEYEFYNIPNTKDICYFLQVLQLPVVCEEYKTDKKVTKEIQGIYKVYFPEKIKKQTTEKKG